MKRFHYLLPAALLLLAACSEEETPRIVPDEPVAVQPAVIDNPSVVAPAQLTKHPDDNIAWYPATGGVTMPYDNGQEITYSLGLSISASGAESYNATVCMIGGSAEDVVIPEELEWTYNRVPTTFKVTGFSLVVVAEGNAPAIGNKVKTITLPKTCAPVVSSSTNNMNDCFSSQLSNGENLEKIYLEDGYAKFCSIDGAVYTADGKTLVAVPAGRKGQFAAAEGTEVIASNAFRKCDKLEIVSLPASVTEIEDYAFLWNDKLALINILSATAPTAPDQAFGHYARKCVVRVQANALASYFPEAPVAPVEPAPLPPEPAADASDEEWEAYEQLEMKYYEDVAQYEDDVKTYESDLAKYEKMGGYKTVEKLEAWDF